MNWDASNFPEASRKFKLIVNIMFLALSRRKVNRKCAANYFIYFSGLEIKDRTSTTLGRLVTMKEEYRNHTLIISKHMSSPKLTGFFLISSSTREYRELASHLNSL